MCYFSAYFWSFGSIITYILNKYMHDSEQRSLIQI